VDHGRRRARARDRRGGVAAGAALQRGLVPRWRWIARRIARGGHALQLRRARPALTRMAAGGRIRRPDLLGRPARHRLPAFRRRGDPAAGGHVAGAGAARSAGVDARRVRAVRPRCRRSARRSARWAWRCAPWCRWARASACPRCGSGSPSSR
jgi:hypothetical protein